jgi:hypothetical protein
MITLHDMVSAGTPVTIVPPLEGLSPGGQA